MSPTRIPRRVVANSVTFLQSKEPSPDSAINTIIKTSHVIDSSIDHGRSADVTAEAPLPDAANSPRAAIPEAQYVPLILRVFLSLDILFIPKHL